MASYNRPVRALGHPVHQMLVALPVALFGNAVVFDAIDLFGGSSLFRLVGYWDLAAGLVGAVLVAVFGLADWLTVPAGTRANANPDAPSSLSHRPAGRGTQGRTASA